MAIDPATLPTTLQSKWKPLPRSGQQEDELWVIAKNQDPEAVIASQPPRGGALMARIADTLVACPLKHTDVSARVDGFVASVNVTQQYHNPFAEKIEAVYVFPLPENAAVNEFVMTIGDRTIRGIIREKEEAKAIYEQARSQGYVVSLLQQDRPNVFTQKVANIEPGKQIDVSIRYFNPLAYVDGWCEFTFPMVVMPRFNPPHVSDGVGAVARVQQGASGQSTEVQYLTPGERSGHDIALKVELNAGVKIEEIKSINHDVTMLPDDAAVQRVTLSDKDNIPNKDFVLRYKVAGDSLKSAVVAQRDPSGKGGTFAVMLYPPDSAEKMKRRPVDLCFVMDVSGSMSGQPMDQSKAAMRAAMGKMTGDDTVQVIRFAGSAESLSARPLPVTKENVSKVMKFVENSTAGGGTMMLEGIRAALNEATDDNRVRYVCLLTDGAIGNEKEIIQATRAMRGNTRVFGFGVGSSPNRFLLDGVSRAGAGAVAYLSLNEPGDAVMAPFFDRISRPALTDIDVDTSNLAGAEISSAKIADVFAGRAVVVSGRFTGDGGKVVVRGRADGQVIERSFDVRPTETGTSLAGVWARQKIADLTDVALFENKPEALASVKQVALDYNLMSEFTSFVAVDSSQVTAGTHGTSVAVPVAMPDGVRYETTVTEK